MQLNPNTLSSAAQSFGVGIAALRPLGGMDGLACEYKSEDQSYVLKIIRADKDNKTQLQQIKEKLSFIDYLDQNGVSVTAPIVSPQGNWIEEIETEEGSFLVTASPKAPGKHADLHDPRQGKPELFQAWGQVTGQMHTLAKEYAHWNKENNETTINDWKDEHTFFSNWCQFDDVKEKWLQTSEELAKLPQTRNSFGLIHNDLHPWNFFIHDNKITVIDFDVAAYHWFIKDIAIALFFANWSGNPGKGGDKNEYLTVFFQNFMRGYSTQNNLNDFWFQQLPLFLKHHQILLFTVFTDEWKNPNNWQANTLKKWKRDILNDTPVVTLIF